MPSRKRERRTIARAIGILVLGAGLTACDKKKEETPPPPGPTSTAPAAVAPTAAPSPPPAPVALPTAWTPEALEELLAPIALYPDPILAQVLTASTNPQEVLDAGNWLLQNQSLSGNALDEAAGKVGFTPPIRALIQFPETLDMMCMQLDWTTELGQAFTADQPGVLDAVQRLRKQAVDVGNLQSSEQMKVETEEQAGKEVVTVTPPSPEVIYVPQYDPVAAYAPPPATMPVATTTTTTTTSSDDDDDDDDGHSTGALVTTGLLAFGAGILVNEVFDDDDDWDDHYDNDYWYGGMPPYPPYPYRPAYGGGYYPSNGYNRPVNYQRGFNNNNIVVVNKDDNYWNDRARRGTGTAQGRSPITKANPRRQDLQQLNQRQPSTMQAGTERRAPSGTKDDWRGQTAYAGAKGGSRPRSATSVARPTDRTAGATSRGTPKVQGSYAGATPERAKRSQSAGAAAKPTSRPESRPAAAKGDRGHSSSSPRPQPDARPAARPAAAPTPRPQPAARSGAERGGTAVSGMNRGSSERAASQRGRQSMPQGARSRGGGGGGGGDGGRRDR